MINWLFKRTGYPECPKALPCPKVPPPPEKPIGLKFSREISRKLGKSTSFYIECDFRNHTPEQREFIRRRRVKIGFSFSEKWGQLSYEIVNKHKDECVARCKETGTHFHWSVSEVMDYAFGKVIIEEVR